MSIIVYFDVSGQIDKTTQAFLRTSSATIIIAEIIVVQLAVAVKPFHVAPGSGMEQA